MRDLASGDRPNGECLHGGDCGGPAVERRKLDLECLPIRIDVNHGPNIADFKALSRYRLGQDDSIVFPDHFERYSLLLSRIRSHEPRRIPAAVDDPNGSD
jgi:hypothetical protein